MLATALSGMVALVVNLGTAYLTQTQDQTVADVASVAAALSYSNTSTTTSAQYEACIIARVNGINPTCSTATTNYSGTTSLSTTIGTSTKTTSDKAVNVALSTPVGLDGFGAVIAPKTSLKVGAQAVAQVAPTGGGECWTALNPASSSNSGITDSGSAIINASSCPVASGGKITLSGGATIDADGVQTASTVSTSGSAKINLTSGSTEQQNYAFTPIASQPSDPLASSDAVNVGFYRLDTVISCDGSTANQNSSSCGSGGYSPSTITSVIGTSSSIPSSSTSVTVNCSTTNSATGNGATIPSGAYTNITISDNVSGACAVTIDAPFSVSGTLALTNTNSSGSLTVTISNISGSPVDQINKITATGYNQLVRAANNTFEIYGGLSLGNYGQLSFGCSSSGSANSQTGGCSPADSDTNNYYILNGVSDGGGTFLLGNGNFYISGGVQTSSSGTLQFGSGTNFIVTDTGVNLSGGTFVVGSDSEHDINACASNKSPCTTTTGAGNAGLNASSTVYMTFGAGPYTINGYLSISGAGSLTGTGVAIITSGPITLSGSASVNLTAPTSGAYSSPAVVLATESTSGNSAINLSGSSNMILDGSVYAPYGGTTLSGSGSISDGSSSSSSGSCLQFVSGSFTLSGSSSSGVQTSTCTPDAAGYGSAVSLVQ